MDIKTQLEDFAEGIAQDGPTAAWCGSTYDRPHWTYVNYDERDMPPADKCPWVAIYPVTEVKGRALDTMEHGFEVVCCIYDSSSRVRAEERVTEYNGVIRLVTFKDYVKDAILGVDIGGALISEVHCEFETIAQFPYLTAGAVYIIRQPVTIGTDPLD